MRQEFETHKLNDQGLAHADTIARYFDSLVSSLEDICGTDGRPMSIVRTKLEEACFFAKKAMASRPENQVQEGGE